MSNITNAKFTDADHTGLHAEFDGNHLAIPVSPDNRHYAEIVEQEIEIAPYVEPEPSWVDSRIVAYGSIGDQLDMQYWDSENGTTVWADHVAKVKLDFPKPDVD